MANILDGINSAQDFLNQNNPLSSDQRNQFKSDGFLLPSTPSADGNGLPYTKIPNAQQAQVKRNIITWFVPEFGIVRMFINPQSITYSNKKLIQKDRTKGGYTLQYWGEELTTIDIRGTSGSSGIEGINMLYEIYRAEQYAFDPVALSLAANNASSDLANNLISGAGGALDSAFGFGSGSNGAGTGGALLSGITGLDSPNNTLAPKNIPSLAQLAFTVEMYYNGWVYRGYFDHMNITEKADNFLFDYDMTFIATQRRGYRLNNFPWHKSANNGPSSDGVPYSFSGNVIKGQ